MHIVSEQLLNPRFKELGAAVISSTDNILAVGPFMLQLKALSIIGYHPGERVAPCGGYGRRRRDNNNAG